MSLVPYQYDWIQQFQRQLTKDHFEEDLKIGEGGEPGLVSWHASITALLIVRDAYLLGSLVYFFFLRIGMTPAILKNLPQELRPENWGGDFNSALPYIRDSWDESLGEFENYIKNFAGQLTPELVEIVRQLTDPDPTKRGHPKNIIFKHGNPFSFERYISWFNRLARRAEVKWL